MGPVDLRGWTAADWRASHRRLPTETVRLITAAVRRGEAVPDPFLASVAVGCARAWRQRMVLAVALVPALAAAIVGIASVQGEAVGALGWTPLLAVPLLTVFSARRARRAEAANADVVARARAGTMPLPSPAPRVVDVLKSWRANADGDGGLRPRLRYAENDGRTQPLEGHQGEEGRARQETREALREAAARDRDHRAPGGSEP